MFLRLLDRVLEIMYKLVDAAFDLFVESFDSIPTSQANVSDTVSLACRPISGTRLQAPFRYRPSVIPFLFQALWDVADCHRISARRIRRWLYTLR
jgi:hypothetical protein